MPPCRVPFGAQGCLSLGVERFTRSNREMQAAKVFFHISGRQARRRVIVVARSGWPYRDCRWCALFFGGFQSVFGQLDTGLCLDPERGRAGSWLSHAVCGVVGVSKFLGDCHGLVSRAIPESA
jgi:hypothetical protein